MSKYLIIFLIFVFSLFCGFYVDLFILNKEIIFDSIIGFLGVSVAIYTLLLSPLASIYNNSNNKEELSRIINKYLDELSSNIKFLFISLLIIIIINIVYLVDIPCVKNNFKFILLTFNKQYICNVLTLLCFLLSMYAFWDIMISSFTICNKSIKNKF